ncbi:hypothetical protein CROQUDRAFT_713086 [Cronartium quercuum f. sp. fusiforme G11]|uniref:Uncharacterized protein n=1 Tax=Cronartium quercuum f. sp. fusiforme G11 TaxID=708437 RepID=A0A9P6NRX9_9BASI|nr:hypothetical protein CROQUDRAFT_713086 [Cronartium quercuum f. sp. fusiforme G11]
MGLKEEEEEDVPDEKAKKKSKKPFLSWAMSNVKRRLGKVKQTAYKRLGKTQAIKSPYPEEFSIPEIRLVYLQRPEISWAEETLRQLEPLIQFAGDIEGKLSSKKKRPGFYDSIQRDLQASSASSSNRAQSVPKKIGYLDELPQLNREMQKLYEDIDEAVNAIIALVPQLDGPINRIKTDLGSAGSPLAKYPDFIPVVELFGSNTIREPPEPKVVPKEQIEQLCNDLGLEKRQVNYLYWLQEDLKQLLFPIKGPDVTELEYWQTLEAMDRMSERCKNSEGYTKEAATKDLQNLLGAFPFMYRYIDCAAQYIPDKLDVMESLERTLTGQSLHGTTSSSRADTFIRLKDLLETHKSENSQTRRTKFEVMIGEAHDKHLQRVKNEFGTKVSWEDVLKRVVKLHQARGDLFDQNSKAARVEFLLSLYSPTNPFTFDSLEEAESLGLKVNSIKQLSKLRMAVGQFRTATRAQWLRVQRLRQIFDTYADILPEKLSSFITIVSNAVE